MIACILNQFSPTERAIWEARIERWRWYNNDWECPYPDTPHWGDWIPPGTSQDIINEGTWTESKGYRDEVFEAYFDKIISSIDYLAVEELQSANYKYQQFEDMVHISTMRANAWDYLDPGEKLFEPDRWLVDRGINFYIRYYDPFTRHWQWYVHKKHDRDLFAFKSLHTGHTNRYDRSLSSNAANDFGWHNLKIPLDKFDTNNIIGEWFEDDSYGRGSTVSIWCENIQNKVLFKLMS